MRTRRRFTIDTDDVPDWIRRERHLYTSRFGARTFTCTLTGTSNPPSLDLTMNFSDCEVMVFTGNYVTTG